MVRSDAEILALNQVDVSAPSWYEALYSSMIVAVGLLGPLQYQGKTTLTSCVATVNMSDINDVVPKS